MMTRLRNVRTSLIVAIVLSAFHPLVLTAQVLEPVYNETLGFTVDLPGTPWLAMATEEAWDQLGDAVQKSFQLD